MHEIVGSLGYGGRPPLAPVLVEFLDRHGGVVSATIPEPYGRFSLTTTAAAISSVRVVVGDKPVRQLKLPRYPGPRRRAAARGEACEA